MTSSKPGTAPPQPHDGYLRKGWLFREIASPLSAMHSAQGHVGWNACVCELAEIIRKLDAVMLTKQKRGKR